MDDLFPQNVLDVFFDYDKADIRSDAMSQLQKNAAFLRQNGNVRFTIEGHCDERGSAEYTLVWRPPCKRREGISRTARHSGIANQCHQLWRRKAGMPRTKRRLLHENRRAHFTYNP